MVEQGLGKCESVFCVIARNLSTRIMCALISYKPKRISPFCKGGVYMTLLLQFL